MFSQDDIDTDMQYGKITYNKAYPTRQQHAAMDLQNNEIGIQIALDVQKYSDREIKNIFINTYGEEEYLKMQNQFPNHTDRFCLSKRLYRQ